MQLSGTRCQSVSILLPARKKSSFPVVSVSTRFRWWVRRVRVPCGCTESIDDDWVRHVNRYDQRFVAAAGDDVIKRSDYRQLTLANRWETPSLQTPLGSPISNCKLLGTIRQVLFSVELLMLCCFTLSTIWQTFHCVKLAWWTVLMCLSVPWWRKHPCWCRGYTGRRTTPRNCAGCLSDPPPCPPPLPHSIEKNPLCAAERTLCLSLITNRHRAPMAKCAHVLESHTRRSFDAGRRECVRKSDVAD